MININKIKVPADIALLITRIVIGGIFVFSGWMKISDMPATVAMFSSMGIMAPLTYVVSFGEFLGGIILILGLWGEVAALFLAVVMIVAVYITLPKGFQAFSMPLTVLSGLVAILGCGVGKYKIK